MSTNYQRLDCSTGCCKDRLTFLFEQHFAEQDEAFNNLATESLRVTRFMSDSLLPYLWNRAMSGDEAAQEMVIELNNMLGV